MRDKKCRAFTLMELVIVIIVIGILAAVAIPTYNTSKERAVGKEAVANLKLIAAAEKIYRMEVSIYYPYSGAETSIENLNLYLRLSLNESNWDYSITSGDTTSFTAYADRQGSGGYLECQYSIDQSQDEPVSTGCP